MTEARRVPKQSDVAKLAGVSKATVSLVLNGRANGDIQISQETQARVMQAVKQLGYVINPAARSLRGGQNRIMGVFIYSMFPLRDRPFYYSFWEGMGAEAARQDYNLLLFTRAGGHDDERRIYSDGINHLRVADGSVIVGGGNREDLARLAEEHYPFVFAGKREVPGHEISYVSADYKTATIQIIEQLVTLGHRHIALLQHRQFTPEIASDCQEGYCQAHKQLGLSLNPQFMQTISNSSVPTELIHSLLTQGCTAILAENGDLALAIHTTAQAMNKRIPEDFSLVALGDGVTSNAEKGLILDLLPHLSTFLIPREEMGVQAVRLLDQLLTNPTIQGPLRTTIPCPFIQGSTIRALPN